MSTKDAQFAGSVPAIYEQYLVPLLFEPYARDLAARLRDVREGTLIEIAAGTGAVTRTLVESLPTGVQIVATDLNQDMLNVAATRISSPSLTWRQADAQKLPFEDASAEVIVCQFGVMFLPDRQTGYREALRVLRPGGRYIFNVWDRLAENEVSDIVSRAVGGLFPNDPPRFLERTPFGYFDVDVIRKDLEQAGFGRISIDTVEKVWHAASAEDAAKGICQGTPISGEILARDPASLTAATTAATNALTARYGRGPFDHHLQAHVVTASGS